MIASYYVSIYMMSHIYIYYIRFWFTGPLDAPSAPLALAVFRVDRGR